MLPVTKHFQIEIIFFNTFFGWDLISVKSML